MSNRVDGQIWIDKNSPYKLKYHIKGKDYVVDTNATYKVDSTTINNAQGKICLYAGTVVKLMREAGTGISRIAPAKFPDDIDSVIGVVVNDVAKTAGAEAIISKTGYLTVSNPAAVFEENKNDDGVVIVPEDIPNLVGTPVYWYIGETTREEKAGKVSYGYKGATNSRGKLSLHTPIGNYNNLKDPSMNVGYSNLPQVGVVTAYTYFGDLIDTVEIHLNFARFNPTIEWTWPLNHDDSAGGAEQRVRSVDGTKPGIITIRHGLFSDNRNNYNLKNYCDIIALKEHEDESKGDNIEYKIEAPVHNTYLGEDRKTEVQIYSPEPLYYRIRGSVNFKYDKGMKNNG